MFKKKNIANEHTPENDPKMEEQMEDPPKDQLQARAVEDQSDFSDITSYKNKPKGIIHS